ncbi:hypothetical protein AYX15_06060 [Cryptococcus neoformans]|nr:hypothetical protein AYX15_06060 [Cryptococcus neoformans var. grubii]
MKGSKEGKNVIYAYLANILLSNLTLSLPLCLNCPFYLPIILSPLTSESIKSRFTTPPYDRGLSPAPSSATNTQPTNTPVDGCYPHFVHSRARPSHLFLDSRQLPDPRPTTGFNLKRQGHSPSSTSSFHVDRDISAKMSSPVLFREHRESFTRAESREDATMEVSRPIGLQYQIYRSATPDQNPHNNRLDRPSQYLVDPRLKLYPFVLPPNLWEGPEVIESDQEIQQASRPIVPLSLSPLNLRIKTHSTSSLSQSPDSSYTSVAPRIIQNPHFSDPRVGKLLIPSALLNRPSNESLHLSSLIPYPDEPSEMGQLVWLDAKTEHCLKKGGRITVRNYQGKVRSCYSVEAEAILQTSSTRTPSMMARIKGKAHARTALAKRVSSQEAKLSAQVARALIPRGQRTQRGPRGPRMRSSTVKERA